MSVGRRPLMRMALAVILGSIIQNHSTSVLATEMWFYCGCYTTTLGHVAGRGESIGIYTLDPRNGEMRKRGESPPIVNSSHFCLGTNGRFLYCISEYDEYEGKRDGYLNVLAVDPDTRSLSLIQKISSRGAGPAYVSVDRSGRYLLLANYVAENVVVYPIQSDGRLAEPSDSIQHSGNSTNAERQDGPHPHSIVTSPDNRFVYVPDLGADRIVAYDFNAQIGNLTPNPRLTVAAPPGSGPRHIVFSPSGEFAYVSLELSSQVMALAYKHGQLTKIGCYSTLPSSFDGINTCAEVRVASDSGHVYVSNRGHDSLAIFAVNSKTGGLEQIETANTYGEIPRNFGISPDGQWVVAANQNSHSLVSFRRDHSTGKLMVASKTDSTSPAYIYFIDSATK
jgi:6-phosphogluconolactonase